MQDHARSQRIMFILLAGACGPTNGNGNGNDVTGSSAPTTAPTGGTARGLGAPCDHNGDLSFTEGPHLTALDPACGGALCIFAANPRAPEMDCIDDASCNAIDPSREAFTCNDGTCVLIDAFKAERSMCATACESKSDCGDPDPASPCKNGFECEIVSASCCTPMCVCADDLNSGTVDTAKSECAKQAEPACVL